MSMLVRFKKTDPRAVTPTYKKTGDSGMDVSAILETPVFLDAGEKVIIDTGLAFETPEGHEIQVRPRSGLTFNQGLVAALGTCDSNYRGAVKVCLFNHSFKTHKISHGDRIAQIVFVPVDSVVLEEAEELTETERNEAGFGSTGR